MTTLDITKDLIDALRDDLSGRPGKEQCGLLLGTENLVSTRVPALSGRWSSGFHLDQGWLLKQLYEARERRLQILGFYHSHPSGYELEPSQSDLDGHPIASKVLICSENQGRFRWALFEFSPTEDGSGYRRLRASEAQNLP